MPNGAWTDAFLSEMSKRKVPLDFLSWHKYHTEPEVVLETAHSMKGYMTKHGYNIPSFCNEWNYMDWSKRQESLKALLTEKGAAYMMACISAVQKCSDIDMLMYYDTRLGCWCGAFDTITGEPLKGYYPLYWYGMFYDLECDVQCVEAPDKIYTLCGVDKDGKAMAIVTHYEHNDEAAARDITVDFGREGKYEIYRVDKDRDGELVDITSDLTFNMPNYSFVLIKEI